MDMKTYPLGKQYSQLSKQKNCLNFDSYLKICQVWYAILTLNLLIQVSMKYFGITLE
ncbi:hypothetical protein BGP_0066 [Beggiatoa sp. PS]|nr:hypothetical protein BGP_0066 [Beggiatoa sp. PS]